MVDTGYRHSSICQMMYSATPCTRNLQDCHAHATWLLHENGGFLFGALQTCCPYLNTISLIHSSQFRHAKALAAHPSRSYKLIALNPNVMDSIRLPICMLGHSTLRTKAVVEMDKLWIRCSLAVQYRHVFPRYIRNHGRNGWSPSMQVCCLMYFDERDKGWHLSPPDRDRYGYPNI